MENLSTRPRQRNPVLDLYHRANSSVQHAPEAQKDLILRTFSTGELRVLSTAEELGRSQRDRIRRILEERLLRKRDILNGDAPS